MNSSSEKGEQLKWPDIEALAIKVNENIRKVHARGRERGTSEFIYPDFSLSFLVCIAIASHILATRLDLLMCLNVLDDWRLRLLCGCEQSKIGV